MKRSVTALVLALIGLGVGYALFGEVGNRYLDIDVLLGLKKNFFTDLAGSLVGIRGIRIKILALGLAGAVVGFLLGGRGR